MKTGVGELCPGLFFFAKNRLGTIIFCLEQGKNPIRGRVLGR